MSAPMGARTRVEGKKGVTVARAADGKSLAKRVHVQDGTIWNVGTPPWPDLYEFERVDARSVYDLHDALAAAAAEDPAPCALRRAAVRRRPPRPL